MPRRFTSASDDLNEPRVYVNNMNTRHPTTGLPNSRPAKVSSSVLARGGVGGAATSPTAFGYGGGFASSGRTAAAAGIGGDVVGQMPSSSARLPAIAGGSASRPQARVMLTQADDKTASGVVRPTAQELHPNLQQVYNRIMRRLQRQVNYEELDRFSLADQFGVDVDEERAGNGNAMRAADKRGGSDGVQVGSASTLPETGSTGTVPVSSFVRFTAERTNTADDTDVDDAEQSLSQQPCPRTLRLVVQRVQEILGKKLQIAEQGSLKDCLRFTFESRALLDKLLKEIPSYAQYRDETALLELDRASKAAATASMASSKQVSSRAVSRQRAQAMFEEFRKEPVLMPQGMYVQDPESGAVEAVLSTAQERAAHRLGASGESDAAAGVADSSLSAVSPLAGGATAPGSVQMVYSANETGLSTQYNKLAKHLIGAASPNSKARAGASTVGTGARMMQLPETYGNSVRLKNREGPSEQAPLVSPGEGREDENDGVSHSHSRVSRASAASSVATAKPGEYLLVKATALHDEGGGDVHDFDAQDAQSIVSGEADASTVAGQRRDTNTTTAASSITASSSRHAHAAARQARREAQLQGFAQYSTPPRKATQRVDASTLTEESGLTTVTRAEHEAVRVHARDLEVRLAEGRQLLEELRAQLLEESSYTEQKRHIVHYLRRTLVRECNTLRSQLTLAAQRERQLQTALKEANTTAMAAGAGAGAGAGGGGGGGGGGVSAGMNGHLGSSMTLGARRSVFSTPHTGSLTPPAAPALSAASGKKNGSGNFDDDVVNIQSLLDLVLLGVENDETLAIAPDLIKKMDPDARERDALKANGRLEQDQLRAELDERQRQLKETILSIKVKHAYELTIKDREIERLRHLADSEYVHAQLSAQVKKLHADFRQMRNGVMGELQSCRVMVDATVKSLANRARLMDRVAQENVVLQSTLSASTDLIESATNLLLPMMTSEYTHGYHPWPVKLRNTIDPLGHLIQVRYGPAEVVRLRPSLDSLSDLYLATHAFVTQSIVLPDATRPKPGRVLKELCSAILRSPTTTTEVLYEVRRLYECEHQLTRRLARLNMKILWNSYLQNTLAERSMSALTEADLNPRTTTLPVQRRINVLATERRELAMARGQLERERAENAKDVYRIWRDRQIDINEGYASPLILNRLTLLSEAQVHAAQRRGGPASVAVRTNSPPRSRL